MTDFKPGDRVLDTWGDEPGAIPAMQVMFGTVRRVVDHCVFVEWDCDVSRHGSGPAQPVNFERLRLVAPEEEKERRRKAFPWAAP